MLLFSYVSGIDVSTCFLDHMCYRVATDDEYTVFKTKLSQVGVLLSEVKIGGRGVSTFKLNTPHSWKGREIPLVELPQPKASSPYPKGLEHVEFVISADFESFMANHPSLSWDTRARNKKNNPDVSLKFKHSPKNISVKFHHKPLEEVIEIEQALGLTEID